MHRKQRVYSFVISFVVGAVLAASASAQVQGSKIGFVEIRSAIMNTNEAKKEIETFHRKFAPRQNELSAQNEEVEKLKTELKAISDKLSGEERSAREKIISEKQKVLQRNYDYFQGEVQKAEQEVLSRLGQKMIDVIEKYAVANGYTVIFDLSNLQLPVLWASESSNLTKALVDAYNAPPPVEPPKP